MRRQHLSFNITNIKFFKADDQKNGWLGTGDNWEQTRHTIAQKLHSIYSLLSLSSQAPHSITQLISPLSFWETPFYTSRLLYVVCLVSLTPPPRFTKQPVCILNQEGSSSPRPHQHLRALEGLCVWPQVGQKRKKNVFVHTGKGNFFFPC